ncbi:hypothetical protein DFP72DRAFT_1164252 [Ephemerocybe angulata]|uniref:3'-5' exonuclease n=1 Tax=Ephemerocybe angulata TaxID=980116 RepID=A0A8H6IFF0_9AGAR|nr:hypothetical protein DFP72DRAFT_1164252 [Tulosesus angulatus]
MSNGKSSNQASSSNSPDWLSANKSQTPRRRTLLPSPDPIQGSSSLESQSYATHTLSPANDAADEQQLTPTSSQFEFAPVVVSHHSSIQEHETSASNPTRKRGRPKGSTTKLATHGPKRPPGRPPGSGKHQLALARRAAEGLPPLQKEKGKRGRPRKADATPEVSVEFRRFTVPATAPSRLPRSAALGSVNSPATPADVTMEPPPEPPNLIEPTSTFKASDLAPAPFDNEDPQQPVSVDENHGAGHELEEEADGSGLGDDLDDMGPPDNEAVSEGTGEVDIEDGQERSDTPTPRVPHPTPPWLLCVFERVINECSKRNADGLPPLYAHNQTIYVPRPSPSFILRDSTNISPQALYNPQMVVWDPMALCKKGIPCPRCRKPLQRHTHIPRPRRVVDFSECFWLVGYRYRCRECRCTFRSWDKQVLSLLPPSIAHEFPARLSHRSGVSKSLLEWVRSCFRSGMGANQVSDALRSQHRLRYDMLQVQFLHHLASRRLDGWMERKYHSFPEFEDRSPEGYHGYVPSGQYIRGMYDAMIEEHRDDFHQHMSLLPLTIAAADHSHKITKQIYRVGGQEMLIGLHIITNEFSEIRACHLVTTKGHAQTSLALNGVKQSLEQYGHEQPQLWYTDNMADKGLLEDTFPSLRAGVVPTDKYGHLDELEIPQDHVLIHTKDSVQGIDLAMQTIMDDLPNDGSGEIVVGFDSEWNVETSANGRRKHAGKTAIIQIAYKNIIYILQISEMLAQGTLPAQLRAFLANPHIRKVGRLVNADLKRLEKACHSRVPFCGGLDLARLAKDRCILSGSIQSVSLADLCAIFLRQRLVKNVPERLSDLWDSDTLSERQRKYAATDAYASLRIFEEIAKFSVPQPFPSSGYPSPATPVLLYAADRSKIIAVGQVSNHSLASSFDGIKIQPSTTAVDIFHIVIPGAKLPNHRRKSLQDFGKPPFTAIVPRALLRLYQLPPNLTSSPYDFSGSLYRGANNMPTAGADSSAESSTHLKGPETIHAANESGPDIPRGEEQGELYSIADIILDRATGDESDEELAAGLEDLMGERPADNGQGKDNNDKVTAEGVGKLGEIPTEWKKEIRSRVLKDPFHLFNQFYISVKHGLRLAFARALRDAIFMLDKKDVEAITAWCELQNPPQSFDQFKAAHPRRVWEHCKRIIPPPEILYPRVRAVFETYGALKDATTGAPLFDDHNWKVAKNVLDLIYNGYLSDPPGTPLYGVKGIDEKMHLPVYRCFRGTNRTEGVHTFLRRHLPSSGTSIRHAQAVINDYSLCHNLINGTYNRTGKRYKGHFSIWVTNEIQELTIALRDVLIDPSEFKGHVNGNFYMQTQEVIGVLPVPEKMRTDSAMRGYDPIVDSRRKQSHLAQLQGVSKAVLPVHTHRERALFSNLMQRHPAFNTGTAELNWKEAIRVWNRIADQDDQVFYKLTEQLRAYLTKWKVNANIKNTESGTREDRSRVDDLVKNIDMTIPEVPRRHEQPNHTAPNGHRFPHGNEGSPSLHHHSSVLPGTPCHPGPS